MASSPEVVARRVEGYRGSHPSDARAMVQLGRRLWEGDEVSAADSVALGRSNSLVSMVVRDFTMAGYRIERRRIPGGRGASALAYRLEGAPDHVERHPPPTAPNPPQPRRSYTRRVQRPHLTPAPPFENVLPNPTGGALEHLAPVNGARRPVYAHEVPGIAYPALGALLGVRAVALVDGELVLHLADAANGVWQVRVTGHAPG